MKIIKPEIAEVEFLISDNGTTQLQDIEKIGRVSYKSEDRITPYSAEKFVRQKMKHETLLEFGVARVKYIASRGFSHEVVRHRPTSIVQESTRYVDQESKIGHQQFCPLPGIEQLKGFDIWVKTMEYCEKTYRELRNLGWKKEIARGVLPIDLKTELWIQTNFREWRHIFELRCHKASHPLMRLLMKETLRQFNEKIPVVFNDLAKEYL